MSANGEGHCCGQMASILAEGKVALSYLRKYREYVLLMKRGGSMVQLISHCPWCGSKLPSSLRSLWFARVSALGLDPYSRKLPKAYKDDSWWQAIDFVQMQERFGCVIGSFSDRLSDEERVSLRVKFEEGELGAALESLTQKAEAVNAGIPVEAYIHLAVLARLTGRYEDLITPRLQARVNSLPNIGADTGAQGR